MRWSIGYLLFPLSLGACSSEPDFDERFDEAKANIEATAKSIDADLGQQAQPTPSSPGSTPTTESLDRDGPR